MKLPDDVAFIATADLHIDEHNWAHRSELCGDSKWSLRWIADQAIENALPVIAAGDVFDKPVNESSPIAYVREVLASMPFGIYFIQGQPTHDAQRAVPWLMAIDENAMWLDHHGGADTGMYTDIPGFKIHGIDWTPADKLPARLAQIPDDTDIVVMHQVTEGLMGSIRLPELSPTSVPHARLLIVGDYHKHEVKKVVGATGQALTILSPGSTNMRAINEPPDKYVFLVKHDGSYESLRIPTRPFLQRDISLDFELDRFVQVIAGEIDAHLDRDPLLEELPEHIATPILRVRFNTDIPEAYARIRQAVGDRAHLFTEPLSGDRTRGEQTGTVLDDVAEAPLEELPGSFAVEGAVACLPECVDETADPEVFNFCRRLLTEPDAKVIVAEVRKTFIED